jgi:hypothetical protein
MSPVPPGLRAGARQSDLPGSTRPRRGAARAQGTRNGERGIRSCCPGQPVVRPDDWRISREPSCPCSRKPTFRCVYRTERPAEPGTRPARRLHAREGALRALEVGGERQVFDASQHARPIPSSWKLNTKSASPSGPTCGDPDCRLIVQPSVATQPRPCGPGRAPTAHAASNVTVRNSGTASPC